MKKTTPIASLAALSLLTLTACGGGGGGDGPTVTRPTTPEEPTPAQTVTLDGFRQWEVNIYAFDPQTDLPSNGTDGMRVSRPQGAQVTINLEYADGIERRLEGPNWRNNLDAQARLNLAATFIEVAVWTGYKQWARHLDGTYTVDVLVGHQGIERCSHSSLACYIPALDKVVFGEQWLLENYVSLHVGRALGIEDIESAVFSSLVFVATHEAAHQFGYQHPSGDSEGCGPRPAPRCHGPIGSGSVTSYDTLRGLSSRYAPDREDVQHIDGGAWNPNAVDRYKVSKAPTAPSILEFGYWLDHNFEVSGWTLAGQPWGGTFDVRNVVAATPFITGTPSADHELSGNASWSGDFVGYDLLETEMAALTADVALEYAFDTQGMDLAVYDFESWLGDSSTFIGGRYEYGLACTSAGCSYEQAGTPCFDGNATCGGISVQTRFYPHGGDASAYAGGVVNDDAEKYVGAFVAAKD